MRTQQILHTTEADLQPKGGVLKGGGAAAPPAWPVTYVNVGMTRARSKKTAALCTQSGAHTQFCPFWSVDEEYVLYLHAPLPIRSTRSAWISDVFLSLHPFDARNSRVPLLRARLPLINLPLHCLLGYVRDLELEIPIDEIDGGHLERNCKTCIGLRCYDWLHYSTWYLLSTALILARGVYLYQHSVNL
ncbi:hypothetical protein BDZ89DRAFT_1041975 [Hymenopellis radicata]|nr:hypothetical protein BDZ89DRAFT_1041975 [Hymenopellis radicata]